MLLFSESKRFKDALVFCGYDCVDSTTEFLVAVVGSKVAVTEFLKDMVSFQFSYRSKVTYEAIATLDSTLGLFPNGDRYGSSWLNKTEVQKYDLFYKRVWPTILMSDR